MSDLIVSSDQSLSSKELLKIFGGFLRNCSELTAREYAPALREFFSLHANEIKVPGDIKRHHLIDYRKYLEDKAQANKTILKKLSAVSAFCKHLAEDGLVDKDISYGVKRPLDQNKTESADLSDLEVKMVFSSLNPKRFNFEQCRAILAVGFYTGLRSSEIRNLKIGDLGDVKGHRIIRTMTKGSKLHEVPLNPFVVFTINEHIKKLKELGFNLDAQHYLFPRIRSKTNKPYTREGLSYLVKSVLKNAGLKFSDFRRYSPHSMRATFAGHLLNTVKAPLEDVQRLMGHTSPTTTQKYDKRDKSHDKSPIYKIEF